jgi:hypothetical protein
MSRGLASRLGAVKAMNQALKSLLVVGMAFWLSCASQGQAPKSDISSVAAAGKVNGDVYQNSYFGITLSCLKAHWSVRGPISVQQRQGRLIDAVYDLGGQERGPEENYTLALLVESLENFPKGTSTELYVRRVRHGLESGNLKTYREEFPLTVSGIPFTGTVFRFFEKPDSGYYRGLYSTVLNGYFVTIEVQCGREERLQKLLSSALSISPKQKP